MPEVVLRFPEGRYEGEVDDKKVPNGQGCLEFPGIFNVPQHFHEIFEFLILLNETTLISINQSMES